MMFNDLICGDSSEKQAIQHIKRGLSVGEAVETELNV